VRRRRVFMPDKNKLAELDAEFDKLFEEIQNGEVDTKVTEDVEETQEEKVEKTEDQKDLGDTVFEIKSSEKKDKEAVAFKEMREEKSKLKKELEEKERLLEEFELMSRSAGFAGVNQLIDQWKQQQLESEAKTRGVPADVLKQLDEQKRRLEKLEKEKLELESKNKQQSVVKHIDTIVAELKLTTQEADTLINRMGDDGVTWEQLLVLPPAAITNAVKGYATSIILEKERQSVLKKQQSKTDFEENKIQAQRQNPVNKDTFSKEALAKEMEDYRKKNFPHIKK